MNGDHPEGNPSEELHRLRRTRPPTKHVKVKEAFDKMPKNWSKVKRSFRDKVWEQALRKVCHYCFKPLTRAKATVDHVIPQSLGGDNSASNLLLCCGDCNQDKADMTLDEWAMWLDFEESLCRPFVTSVSTLET